MDSPGFSDLKKEDRFKSLEHKLKLAFVKQMDQRMKISDRKEYYCSSPTWPSISSINPDGTDMSYAIGSPSLQVSRDESEVLSSSKNLRKKFGMQQNDRIISQLPMSTSSVKNYSINDSVKDRIAMPPPSATTFNYVKQISNAESKQIAQSQQGNLEKLESNDHDSFIPQPSGDSSNQDSGISQIESHSILQPRVFSRWKVLLNDQDHLIIKGTLECGKIARSKPVIKKLTNTKVLSVYKHIYELHGNIADDRNELPEYVREKFHNGFPDDWENVYHIWKNYVAGGCQITFRWPTPITDSDNDLHSEITDFTYLNNKQIQYKNQKQLSNSVSDNNLSLHYDSNLPTDINRNLEKSIENRVESRISENQILNKKIENSKQSSDVKNTRQCTHEYSNVNYSKDTHSSEADGSNSNLKNINFLYNIIHEDKVRVILSRLGDNNCDAQYLDKFIDLIDCLKYLLQYSTNKNNGAENYEQSLSKIQNQSCTNYSNAASISDTQKRISESQPNVLNDSTNYSTSEEKPNTGQNLRYSKATETAPKKESSKRKLLDVDSTNNLSDSDDYMGFPNVPLNHLIKPKKRKPERYRDRKHRNNDGKNVDKNKQVKEQIPTVLNREAEQYYDSNISISEDDRHLVQEEKKALNPSLPCNDQNKCSTTRSFNRDNSKKSDSGNILEECDEDGFKVPSITNQKNQKLTEKNKPIIKSCMPVNFYLKLRPRHSQKDQGSEVSDVSIVENNQSLKKNTTLSETHKPTRSIHKDDNAEGLNKELIHPFLTYDSEDFLNEKELCIQVQQLTNNSSQIQEKSSEFAENKKVSNKKSLENVLVTKEEIEDKLSAGKKKTPASTESTKKDLFGSKENPKVLTSWIPSVVYDDELKKTCSLLFEGKLLNEAGHILQRKFVTHPVCQRYSATLIQTVNGQYYKLSGEISDTKHVLPKELLKKCRTGCPLKIKEFCEEWKRLRPVVEKTGSAKSLSELDVSIDTLTIPTSSRGRRIIPTLDYWNGERIMLKDNDTIYDPGDKDDTTSLRKAKQSEICKKSTLSSEQVFKKSAQERIKRIAKTKKYSSSSDSNNEESSSKKSSRRSKQKKNNLAETIPSPIAPQLEVNILTESGYNTKLRKRLEIKDKQKPEMEITKRLQVSRKIPKSDAVWTYKKEQRPSDILSDDQASI